MPAAPSNSSAAAAGKSAPGGRGAGPLRILVADHHEVYRDWLVSSIRAAGEMDVCGTTLDGREALELLRAHRPDLALLDQDLPGVPTLSLLRAIARDHLASGVVVVSGNPETRQPYEAVAAGARGYLTHEAGADAITRALVMVARGEVMFAAEVQTKLFERFRERNRDSAPDALEPGTQLLLRLVAQGLEPRDIAARLDLSPAALERRLRAVCERFNVGSPTTAAFNAMEQGLLE